MPCLRRFCSHRQSMGFVAHAGCAAACLIHFAIADTCIFVRDSLTVLDFPTAC